MNKVLSLVVALSFMAGVTMPALAETSANSANDQILTIMSQLRQGMRGKQVELLQTVLAADPEIYPEGFITGFFGNLTANAVKRFQKKHGLQQVGSVGPKTKVKLNEFLVKNPLIEENATSTAPDITGNANAGKRTCAIVPPGHLIAPGWLKKQGGIMPIIPPCQTIPPGIAKKLGIATTTPPTTDTVAPVISSVSASNIASTTATISWTTNELATSKVYHSTTTPVNLATALITNDSSLVTAHTVNISGLIATTTYYYAVESRDAANNVATSTGYSFTTLP